MRVFFSSLKARNFCRKGSALTMGNFDGLHLGHQTLIRHLQEKARRLRVPSIVYTFEPHPVRILAPHVAPPLLNTVEQKIELIGKTGVDSLVIEKFDRGFAKTSPGAFFEKYLVRKLKVRFVIVGYDFTFGAKRKGNIETLERLCLERGIGVEILKPCLSGETLVSSSVLRRYLQEGNVGGVIPLLKRPYFLDGRVIRGSGRGQKIGIPTANLEAENELIPREGVYATRLLLNGKIYPSVTNIGVRPTFGKNRRAIETHVPGFHKNIYGQRVRLFFLGRIRDERRFSGPAKLTEQIKRDIAKGRQILSKGHPHG